MIYKEEEINFNKEKIFKSHLYAYYGELKNFKEFLDVKIIENFRDTMCYCLSEGCKRDKEFVKYCKENFYFDDDNYRYSLSIGYILNGMWDKDLKLYDRIIEHLSSISEENLEKICEIGELNEISSYLCVLHENERLFKKIKNPKMSEYCDPLITRYNLKNLFQDGKKFDPEAHSMWFPIDFKYSSNKDHFTDEIFTRKLTLENLIDVYGDISDKNSIVEISNIKNIEEFIYFNVYINKVNKEVTKYNILNDIRMLMFEEKISEKWHDLINCKLFLIFEDRRKIKNNLFLDYIYQPYDESYIHYVTEQQAWSIIYSLIKSRREISVGTIPYDYIEINCLKAAYETCNNYNIMVLDKIYKRTKKCYKIIDFENKKYIEKEKIEESEMKFEKKFILKDYIY